MVAVSGVAASIRSATESETFDLGGQNVTTIQNTIQSAFQEPFELEDGQMIRLTFVTGAGKQARQRYDEGAARTVTSALQRLGYVEDRGASCVVECAGSYKSQHDTGKNLKTIVVFPKVTIKESPAEAIKDKKESLIPFKSPEYKIAMSTINVFTRMLSNKCPSWSQKKGCVAALEDLRTMVQEMDERLVKGQLLTDAEQDFYDSVIDLEGKESLVKAQMQAQVEKGNITKHEQETLLSQNAERIAAAEKDNSKAKTREKLLQRRELLSSIQPIEPHKLRYDKEIQDLRMELIPLLKLEEDTRGRLNTLKETQTLARKDEILEDIEHLEAASWGWFEDEAALVSRIEASRAAFETKQSKKSMKGVVTIGSNTTTRVAVSKFVTPEDLRNWGKKGALKKKKMQKGAGGLFLMMDESSDEEDEYWEGQKDDDDGDEEQDEVVENDGEEETGGVAAKSKRKRKRKKKSKGAESTKVGSATNAQSTVASSVKDFLLDFLFPLLLSLLTWLITLIFGKPKKKAKKE